MIDVELQRSAELQGALLHRALMHPEIARLLLRVGDAEFDALAREQAGVADLAAGLRIERRLVQHDRAGIACLEALDFLAVLHQRGSLVAPDRLRFDFVHPKPITAEELARVEDIANEVVLENDEVTTRLMGVDDAREAGARALFGEKYGDEVRVVSMGLSLIHI